MMEKKENLVSQLHLDSWDNVHPPPSHPPTPGVTPGARLSGAGKRQELPGSDLSRLLPAGVWHTTAFIHVDRHAGGETQRH